MAKSLAAENFLLRLAKWTQASSAPTENVNAGSWHLRSGTFPADPVETYLNVTGGANGWVHQNLVNLDVYNVKNYGAVGDSVTDDSAAINSAITAALAAGGGVIYFPALTGGNYYRVTKPGSGLGTFQIIDGHNLIFLGDGYASFVNMDGDSAFGDWYMFRIRNGSSNIGFYNLHLGGTNITNPDPGEQNHLIQAQGLSTDPVGQGCSNVRVVGCYWSDIPGDRFRMLGETDRQLTDCMFAYNGDDNTTCRASTTVFRGCYRGRVFYNYATGSADQQFDTEPSGAGGNRSPTDYSYIGNHINHRDQPTAAMAISGISSDDCSRRMVVALMTLTNGGLGNAVSAIHVELSRIENSIWVVNGSDAAPANNDILSIDGAHGADYNDAIGNVIIATGDANRWGVAIRGEAQGVRGRVIDNIFQGQFSGVTSVIGFYAAQLTGWICSGNIGRLTSTPANQGVGIQNIVTLAASVDIDHCIVVGNMFINEDAVNFSDSGVAIAPRQGMNCRNIVVDSNYSRKTLVGVRIDISGGGSFLDWRAVSRNLGISLSSNNIVVPTSNVGVTHDGIAGPGDQIALCGVFPEGNVTAPIGSLCTKSVAGNATILSYKETGSGNTGWLGCGGSDITMGAAAGSAATAARFFAPGGMDLAAESTVEIQWRVPRPGRIRNLRVRCTAGTGGGNNTYTVRKNAANISLSVVIANTGTSGNDTSNSSACVAGDAISFQVTKSVAPATPQTNIIATMEYI